MKKIAKIGAVAVGLALAAPGVAWGIAASDFPVFDLKTGNLTITDIIANVVTILLAIAGGLAVLFLVIGGIRYIISAGNSEQIELAKHTIFNAIIGIVVIVLAIVVLNTVKKLLG